MAYAFNHVYFASIYITSTYIATYILVATKQSTETAIEFDKYFFNIENSIIFFLYQNFV